MLGALVFLGMGILTVFTEGRGSKSNFHRLLVTKYKFLVWTALFQNLLYVFTV